MLTPRIIPPQTVAGTQTDNRGRNVKPKGHDMPYDLVDYWDQRIRADLNARMMAWDKVWEANEALVRNSESGFRDGNIVAEFTKTLHARLLTDELSVECQSDDPAFTDQSEGAEIVANSLQRILDVTDITQDVTTHATWASFGVFEIGHPIDPSSHDPYMSYRSPNYGRDDTFQDVWEEVDPNQVDVFGGGDVLPFDKEQSMMIGKGMGIEDPEPVYQPAFGYPWVRALDPRLIVMPLNVKDPHNAPYICRLRFITRAELLNTRGFTARGSGVTGTYQDLYFKTEEDGTIDLFPEMLLIAEVYIKRDRNNPQFNGWFFSYVLGQPDQVILQGENPHGGLVPFVFVKLSRLKKMYDTTLAQELSRYADLYHMAIRAIERNLQNLLTDKTLVGQGAGLQEPEEKKLLNPNFSGAIHLSDVESVKKYGEDKFDTELLKSMSYIKSLAQSSTGQSDLDRGTAIKQITARQTQALLDATGINVEDMGHQISRSVTELVMKLMHLAGRYSMAGRTRKFTFGGKFTSFSRGTHDFTTSFVYNVKVSDNGKQVTQEERMVWVQFIRTLFSDTQGLLVPYFDQEGIAKATTRIFGQGTSLLASRAAGRPGQGFNPAEIGQLQPGQSGNLLQALAGGGAPMLNEGAEGQHPERQLGSRGVDLGNALRGGMKTGSGSGEL